jgi:hypothetical protein
MSLVIVHLRWDDVDPAQYAQVCQALPDGDRLPPGCFSRKLRLQGRVLHGTEVWAGEGPAGRSLRELPDTVSAARLGPPMTAAFALPDAFAAPYRRAMVRPSEAGTAPAAGRPDAVPGPRIAAHDDAVAGRPIPAGGR